MKLLSALLVANFGHGGSHPKRTAIWRLSLLTVGSIALGAFGMHSIRSVLQLPPELASRSLYTVWLALQCLIICVNLPCATRSSPAMSLLRVLPVSTAHRRLLCCLNHFTYTGLVLLMAVPIFATFLHLSGIPPAGIGLSVSLAILGGHGLFYLTINKVGTAVAGTVLVCEYTVLQHVAPTNQLGAAWGLLFIALGAASCLGAARFNMFADRISHPKVTTKLSAKHLGTRFWFAKKIVRSPLVKSIAITALFAGTLTAYAYHIQLTDSSLIAFLACLLGAASAADIRSLCRASRPAEITIVRGTFSFLLREHISCLGICLAVCPLVCWAFAYSPDFPASMVILASVLSSICFGLFIGTVITPYPGDISAQAASVICSSIVLLVIQKFAPYFFAHCLLLVSSIIGSFVAEFIRNPYTWRYYRETHKSSSAY